MTRNRNIEMAPLEPVNPGQVPDIIPESLFQVMWRHSWITIGCAFIALVAGFIYLAKATPIYTSTASIYVEQSGPKIIGDLEEGVMMGSKNYLYTQAKLITATPIISVVMEDPEIRALRTFQGVQNPSEFLKRSLKANVGKKDDILEVAMESPFPDDAALIVNTVVNSYMTFHAETKRLTASEVLSVLQAEKLVRSAELTASLEAMMAFKDEHEGLSLQTTGGSNMILERLDRTSSALTSAHLATLEAKSFHEAAKKMVGDPDGLRQFIEAQQINRYGSLNTEKIQLTTQLEALQMRLADRLRMLTTKHPSVEALEIEITETQKKLAQLDDSFVKAHLAMLEQRYLVSKEQEDELARDFDTQRTEVLELSKEVSEYTLLQSAYDQVKKTCDIIDDRMKELSVKEDAGVLNITWLESAVPSDLNDPSSPRKVRVMAMALVLGLMMGGGLALLRDMMDHRIHSSEEVAGLLHAPLLGTVPAMNKRLSPSERGQKVHLEGASVASEAYRTIRTAVFFSVSQDQAQVIQVTSPMQGEGKSTLASNLAIAMAQSGQRVLVIDGDFRRPSQHMIFDAARDKGLSGILAGLETMNEAVVHTEVPGLDLLPCGPDVPNPAEMLGSQGFRDLLNQQKENYDRVLIDSTPVVPVADATILAAVSDVTILVVRAEKSTRKSIQQAASQIMSLGGRLLGAVINDVKQGSYGYGYGYGYGRGYGYGYGKSKKQNGNGSKVRALNQTLDARMRMASPKGQVGGHDSVT